MDSNVTLTNSSQFYLSTAEVFLRSIPARLKLGDLSEDALRLLVYYVSRVSPFELAVESGYFEGTLDEWFNSLKANLQFKEVVETYADLVTVTTVQQGDLVFVKATNMAYIYDGGSFADEDKGISITGPSAYDVAVANGFQGSSTDFIDSLKGETGDEGEAGLPGKSAYQVAVAEGFVGTAEEWVASLVGIAGKDGDKGAKGDKGDKGLEGQSAFNLAVLKGFVGTEEEWLLSLKGEKGAKGAQGDEGPLAKNNYELYLTTIAEGDTSLNLTEWLAEQVGPKGDSGTKGANGKDGTNGGDGKDGVDGKSAYTLAVDLGFEGDEASWVLSLKGVDGTNGKDGTNGLKGDKGDKGDVGSAFKYADFTTEQLASLKGAKGDKGDKGTDGTSVKGDKGDAFVYADFTTEQITALKGAKGDKGDKGDKGADGTNGVTPNATTITFADLSTETIAPITAEDTLLIVVGKLQAQITALEARLATLETA